MGISVWKFYIFYRIWIMAYDSFRLDVLLYVKYD